MIQFFSSDISASHTLPADESAHCCRVLRKREGDNIVVVDGKGYRYNCVITDANPKATQVKIESFEPIVNHWDGKIVMAIAPTKNLDRMEWLVEKAVEIGVDKIIFVNCDRSERKVLKTERLKRIAISAMKQSLKAKLPEITEMISFSDFIRMPLPSNRIMAYCGEACLRRNFNEVYKPHEDVVILIGPEGDFSPHEVNMALDEGFIGATFGNCRLRTETAALYGLTAVHVLDS